MESENIIKPNTNHRRQDEWETSNIAEMIFEACISETGLVTSNDVTKYVKDLWGSDDNSQVEDQLRRLLLYLDPGGRNDTMNFQEFVDKFTKWTESEQRLKEYPNALLKVETYETECEDNGTMSSTTESLLSWDYPLVNGCDPIALKKENQILKEQISSAELYNSDLVEEVNQLQNKLKSVSDSRIELESEIYQQVDEIASLKRESLQWKQFADEYKDNFIELENKMKRTNAGSECDDMKSLINMDEFITVQEHTRELQSCKRTITDLNEKITFLKKENEMLGTEIDEMKNENYSSLNGDLLTLHEELLHDRDLSYVETPALFLSEDDVEMVLSDGDQAEKVLSSFLGTDSLQHFSNLVTSVAKQLNRVLKSLPPNFTENLIPQAEKHLFVDTLHQMAASKHLSEVKITQLVDLFRRLRADHAKLGDKHVCLQSDYQTLLSEYEDMRSEIISITRCNAQLRNEVLAVYDMSSTEPSPPKGPEMPRNNESSLLNEIDDLKKKLKGTEKANFTLTLAIEEQTKQRNALQSKIDEIQTELSSNIVTISKIQGDNKTLIRDNEKLAETYTRQRTDLDDLRKEWVAEMDRCTTIENDFNNLNYSVVEHLRNLVKTLSPDTSFSSLDTSLTLPVEEWTSFLNREFLEASKIVEEVRVNRSHTSSAIKTSVETQTTFVDQGGIDSAMKGNLSRAACFEEADSFNSTKPPPSPASSSAGPLPPSTVPIQPTRPTSKVAPTTDNKLSTPTAGAGAAPTTGAAAVGNEADANDDLYYEYQFTTDVSLLSKKAIEGEFQAIMLAFENDTFTLQKRLTMHERALQKATSSFENEIEHVKVLVNGMKNDMSDFLSDERSKQLNDVWNQISLLPETFQAVSTSAVATGKCQQEEKHIRNFEVMIAHVFHTKKALTSAIAVTSSSADSGLPKKDFDRAAIRKKTLAVAAAMRKDEEKQKQNQSTESNSVFSSFAGVVKNLMVKTPAEPDLANRRATEMMQRMKTVENLGADKEALYKEGFRGGLSSGLHDTFENIKKEQRTCDENVDSLNKRAAKLEREVAFYRKHSNHLFYGGAATPAATLRTIFCTVFINLFVLFLLLVTVPLPEHTGYTLGTGYISLQEFITSQFLNIPDRSKPLL